MFSVGNTPDSQAIFAQDKQTLIQELTKKKAEDIKIDAKNGDKKFIIALGEAYTAVINYLEETSAAQDSIDFTQRLLAVIPIANVKAYIRLLDVIGKIPDIKIMDSELVKTQKKELSNKLIQKKIVIDSAPRPDFIKDGYNFFDAKDALLDSLENVATDPTAASERKLIMSADVWERKINLARIKIKDKLEKIENKPGEKSTRTLQLWQVIANEGFLPAKMIWHCVLMFAQNSNKDDAVIDIEVLRGYLSNKEIKISMSLSDALYDFFIENKSEFFMVSANSTFRRAYGEWQFEPLNLGKAKAVFSHVDLPYEKKIALVNFVLNILPKDEKRISDGYELVKYLNTLFSAQEPVEELTATQSDQGLPQPIETTQGETVAESSKTAMQRMRSFSLRTNSSTDSVKNFNLHNTISGIRGSLRRATQQLSKNTIPDFKNLIGEITHIIAEIKNPDLFMRSHISSLEQKIALLRPALLQKQKTIIKIISASDSTTKEKVLGELNQQVDFLLHALDAAEGVSKLQEHVARLQETRTAISSSDPLVSDWSSLLKVISDSPASRAIDTLKQNFEKAPVEAPKKFEGIDSSP
jgi:hypothetical protein